MELNMDYTTDKVGKKAKAKAAKAAERQAEQPQSIAALIEASMLESAFNETKCGNCDKMRKANYIWGLAFWSLIFIYLIFGVAAVTLVNAHQMDSGEAPKLIARGLEADTIASVMDSACTVSTSITYPAPSAAFVTKTVDGTIVTETVDGATATGDVTVTPIASQTTSPESACSSPETVTVTVTTVTDNDAMTAGAGGAPPQTSEEGTTASTTDSSVQATVTITESYTVTASTTSAAESTTTTQATTSTSSNTDSVTTQHTTTTTQFITVRNSTGTTTTTLLLDTPGTGTASLIATLSSMPVGGILTSTGTVGTVGTMMGTAGGPQPSTNGSLTYSVPAVSASSVLPTVVSSSGSSSFRNRLLALRGAGGVDGAKRDHLVQRGGSSSGFYCVVMAVACAVAVLV